MPVSNHLLSEKAFANVQSEFPLVKLHSVSSCPVTGHQRKEISTSSSAALLEEVADCDEVISQSSLQILQNAVKDQYYDFSIINGE